MNTIEMTPGTMLRLPRGWGVSALGGDLHLRSAHEELTTRTFCLRAESVNEKERSVEAVIATEAPVSVYDWYSDRIVDEVLLMSGCRLPESRRVSLLNAHWRYDLESVIGSCRELRVEGDKMLGRNVISAQHDDIWQKVREGHITDNSVGYRVLAHTDIEPGQTAVVAGRSFTAGKRRMRITTEWEIRENSLVPIGADAAAKMRAERFGGNHTNNATAQGRSNGQGGGAAEERAMTFEEFVRSRGKDAAKLTDAERTALSGEWEGTKARSDAGTEGNAGDGQRAAVNPPKPQTPATPASNAPATGGNGERSAAEIATEAIRLERERCAAIRTEADGIDVAPEVIERAIANGDSIETFRGALLTALRAGHSAAVPGGNRGPAIHAKGNGEPTRDLITDALLMRAGVSIEDKKLTPQQNAQRAERAEAFRDMPLVDVCREALRLEGKTIPTSRADMFRAAIATVTLPHIFSAVANKAAMVAIAEANPTSVRWAMEEDVPDFKTNTRVNLGEAEELQEVNDAGEITTGTVLEEKESYAVTTFAKNFGITRKDMINDDLGVLTSRPQAHVLAAIRTRENKFYTHLLSNPTMGDSVALFHASHANLISGGTSVLGDTGLGLALQKFRNQVGIDGKTLLNLEPRFLIVPPALERTAVSLTKSDYLSYTGDTNATVLPFNMWKGRLEPIVEPRLENANYTGYSATAWYLACAPTAAPTMVIGYLRGTGRRPMINQEENKTTQLVLTMAVVFDFGVKALGHRGMVKSAGA